MENAAKALTIAGGVLIAIIVVATLWYSFQQWGILPQAKADSEKISQEVEFNKEFESYNKQNLYGTDVITVINKAIANNEKYGIEGDTDDPYFVDVEFKLATNVYGYTKIYTRGEDGKTTENTTYDPNASLSANTPYSLRKTSPILYQLTSENPVEVKENKKGNIFTRTEKYSKDEDFKLRYFTCDGIEYESTNGRVSKIVFRELTMEELKKFS